MSAFVREAWGGAFLYVQYCCKCAPMVGKKCSREKQNRLEAKQDREGNRVASVSEQKLFVIAAVVSTELRRTSDWTI